MLSFPRNLRRLHQFASSRTTHADFGQLLHPSSSISQPEISRLLQSSSFSPTPPDLDLDALLSFARPPLSQDRILGSAYHLLEEVPKRLATRVRSLEALPFIVCSNPYISSTLAAYRKSFGWLATRPKPESLAENDSFVEELEDLVASHAHDIPTMAKGFQECSRYMTPGQISEFLDSAIGSRITVRLACEHHIALSRALRDPNRRPSHIGVIDTRCSPKDMVQICARFVSEICEATLGVSPGIIIDGRVNSTFAYVPVHLEYIITEILKNAFRATVEHYFRTRSSSSQQVPPVIITLCPPPSYSDPRSTFFTMRVRDQGGGISNANMAKIFSYAFTTAGRGAEDDGGPYAAQHVGGAAAIDGGDSVQGNIFGEIAGKGLQSGIGSTLSGLGYGLPMSKLYASYFGGSLDLMPLEGWGTDVFIKVRSLEEAVKILK